MGTTGGAPIPNIDVSHPCQRAARFGQLRSQLIERQTFGRVFARCEDSPPARDSIRRHAPKERCSPAQLGDHLPRGQNHRLPAGYGGTAPGAGFREADGIGVCHAWPNPFQADAQHLGSLHGQACPRSRYVNTAGQKGHRAVGIDTDGTARLSTPVAPVSLGHTASSIGSFKRGAVVRVFPRSLEHLSAADALDDLTVEHPRAFSGAVQKPKLQGIYANFFCDLVNDLFTGKYRLRKGWCTIRSGFGFVDHNIVSIDLSVRNLVRSKNHACSQPCLHLRISACFIVQLRLYSCDLARQFGPHLYLDSGARSRPGTGELLRPVHHHLDRAVALAREQSSQDFYCGSIFSTKAATDLSGDDTDFRHGMPQQLGDLIANREGALRSRVNGQYFFRTPNSGGGVRFDVAWMHRRRMKLTLQNNIGFGEALLRITFDMLYMVDHIAGIFAPPGQ